MLRRIGGVLAIFLVAMATLWHRPILLTGVTVILSIVLLVITQQSADVTLYIVMTVLGFIGEIIFVSLGTWEHGTSQLAGIPYWIPFAWGVIAVGIKYLSRKIDTVIT
ncbi:MAG: hypothetical protein ABEI52_02705 [Halobacteriaceae archaeon]